MPITKQCIRVPISSFCSGSGMSGSVFVGPLVLLWCFTRTSQGKENPTWSVLCWSLIGYEAVYVAVALILAVPQEFETFARFQPMRSLHLLYTFLIILGGGLIGKYLLKGHVWRWLVLFGPLCFGMWFAQRQLFLPAPTLNGPVQRPPTTGFEVRMDPHKYSTRRNPCDRSGLHVE